MYRCKVKCGLLGVVAMNVINLANVVLKEKQTLRRFMEHRYKWKKSYMANNSKEGLIAANNMCDKEIYMEIFGSKNA
ncbi:MAG: hypothetical protein ACLTGX_02290 [Clostridium sp.]